MPGLTLPIQAGSPTIWGHILATTRILTVELTTRVRWAILRRTGMGFTTWRGMWGSGVGTGLHITAAPRRLTRLGRHQATTGCIGAAAAGTTRATAGRRIATATPRPPTSPTWGSVPSRPQIRELAENRVECPQRSNRSEWRLTAARHGAGGKE